MGKIDSTENGRLWRYMRLGDGSGWPFTCQSDNVPADA
jgi:hypothetical protein